MSKQIDQRVVEMEFNNKNFEKNVKTSMSTLDKLKNMLNFGKETKSLDDLQRRADSVKFHGLANTVESLASKFSGLQLAGTLAMYKIADAAANAGIQLVKSLSIDNITAGFQKLSEETTAVSTLVSQGYSLDTVEKQLDKLNWFTDETSYNFSEMINNIAKFTATGKGLDESVTAMQGIAIWAAASGQNAEKASMAMYQLSQALSAGVMRKEDWKSIQNVNMDTAEFREQALAAGVALKTLKKNADGTYTSLMNKNAKSFKQSQFSEHLTEDAWFTSEVMMQVYGNYSKAADGIYNVVNKMQDSFDTELIAGQVIQAAKAAREGDEAFEQYAKSLGLSTTVAGELKTLTLALDDFGLKNFALAQEYKTFRDVVNATQDAVSSKWKAVFKNILGNYEEQKELWTSIGESFYDIFATPVGNLASLTADWKDLGGRTALLEGLSNVVSVLGSVIAPVKEAFREIFPPMTAKRLVELTEKFRDFTAKLTISEKTADKIRTTFKGLLSVAKTVINVVVLLGKAVFNLIGVFLPLGNGILTATAALGKWLEKTTKVVRDSKIINKVLTTIVDTIKKVTQKLGEFIKETLKFDRIMNFFKGMFAFIQKIGLAIGKVFASIIRNGDLKNVMDIFNAGLFSGLILTVTKLFKNLSEATKSLSETFKGIQGLLSGVKDILAAYTKEINSRTLLNIAKAVALLAASLLILSLIPSDKIASSLGALAGVMAEFMIMFKVFTKISGDVTRVGRSSIAMISMALSITILAGAMKKLGSLNPGQITSGLLGMAGAMTILMVALHTMPDNKKIMLKSIGLINMAIAMNLMASALKKMGSIPILNIGKGLLALAGSMSILMIVLNKMPSGSLVKGFAMISLALSLLILGSALEKLGALSWGEIGRSLTVMAGALLILVLSINALPTKGVFRKALSMIPLTTSLLILGASLKKLSQLSWNDIRRSLTAMGGALALLVASTSIMSKMGAKTGGLLVASAALLLFAVGMKSLAKISWEGILKAFTALAVGITALVVAAHLLSPVAGTLMIVAGAMVLFGIAAIAFGVGLTLIATGIGALGIALATGATAIVAGLSAIILGILGMVPEIIQIAKLILIGLAETLGEVVPLLAKAFVNLLYEAIKMLADYVPLIATAIMDLLINTLRAVADRAPELIISIVELLESIFRGFVEAFKIMDPAVFLNGIKAIGLLTVAFLMMAALATIFPKAMLGILAFGVLITELALILALIGKLFGDGSNESIAKAGDILMAIGTAIGQFIGGIVGGIGAGISNSMPKIATNLSEFMNNLQPFLAGANAMSPATLGKIILLSGAILVLSAANFITGLMTLLSLGQSLPKLGTDLGKFGENIKPFTDMASTITPNMIKGVNALTGSIVALTAANVLKGVTSFLTGGKNSFTKFGKEIAVLGTYMNQFVRNLGNFSSSQVKTIESACNGLTTLADASKKIPNEGGVWGWLAGDNSIGKFSAYLPEVGTNLNQFVSKLGTFTEAQVVTVGAAANAIKLLAQAGKEIPNEGGVWGWLAGDNSIGKFSEHLPVLGENLNSFVESLGTFNEAQVMAAECAGNAILALAKAAQEIPNEGGLWQKIIGSKSIAAFGDKLPMVGSNLNKFISNLGTFGQQQLDTVSAAGNAILALAKAAKEIPNEDGIWQKIVGEKSIASFGDKLPGVGKNIASFVQNLGTFSNDQLNTTDCAGRAIAALGKAAADIPAEGSIWEGLLGKKSLAEFSDKLPGVATNLATFVSNLGTFTEDQVVTADCAGRAIAELGQAAGNIPAEDGIWQKIVGEKSIASFGDKLPGVGTNLAGFVKNLGTFTDDQVKTTECAANAIAGFAKAGSDIPNSGGLVSLFTGDNDIKKFAEKLPEVGAALGNFIRNIGTFGQQQINTTNAAVNAMKALANFGSVDTGKVKEVLEAISAKLSSFGTSLSGFVSGMSAVSSEDIEGALVKMTSITDMAKELANINVDSLNSFGDSLEKIGTESMSKFVNAFAGEEPKDKAVRGIKDTLSAMLTGLESKRTELTDKFSSLFDSAINKLKEPSFVAKTKEAGKYFAQGFADGIRNNQYLATDAGTALGNAAYNGAKKAIDAHSPSRKAYQLGEFFGQGYVNAVVAFGGKVYDESYNMGTQSANGLSKGLESMDRLLGDSMNNGPTIKPVLDLSEVQSGAKTIAGMFNNANVGTNLNAISVGMSRRGQNGVNDDVVSAIDRLGSNLGGDTYNINGVSYADTDSDIAKAIGVLVRAAKVERRT